MVTRHLREKNGYFQMILSYKDMDGRRQTKSVSTGLSPNTCFACARRNSRF